MNIFFIRAVFFIITNLFSLNFVSHYFQGEAGWMHIAVGVLGGLALTFLFIGFDVAMKRVNLKSFNTVALGLFFGFLMAQAILFTLEAILNVDTQLASMMPLRFGIYLASAYFGVIITARTSEEIHVAIPFIHFQQAGHKKKDILADLSILTDPRIIDLASSGLLDHHLMVPRWAVKELYTQSESNDEGIRTKARRSLDVLKKLEGISTLDLRYIETDFPEIKDCMPKLIRLARFLDTHIITSDINRIQQSSIEGVRIININMLSRALQPITQAGEYLSIKIQRYGKEPRQGVGYLEDGTMVVVNGGAEFIGETIKAQVLSVKHTSSGRMIFCNAAEEGVILPNDSEYSFNQNSDLETSSKSCFTL